MPGDVSKQDSIAGITDGYLIQKADHIEIVRHPVDGTGFDKWAQEKFIPMADVSVLVIDDNPDILDVVRIQLEAEGLKVITAEDCSSALDYLTLNRPDVIVTDLMLPEVNGLELIHQLRRISNYDHIPIIAMSAYDKTYLAAAIVAGAVNALHKPEELGKLMEVIEQAVAMSRKKVS